MAEPIISVSGMRGVVGETLTPEVAVRYVAAFAALAPPGPIVLGRDGRASGRMLAEAVRAGLHASGRTTLQAGVAPTPTVGILVRKHQCAGGVQITASHNPPEYDGLKLFSAEGRVIPAGPGREVLSGYRSGKAAWVPHHRLGTSQEIADPEGPHLQAVLATVDVETIRARRLKVLLDANRGSGGRLGRLLLEALGCEVTVLGEQPDGHFEHPAEPTAENLTSVLPQVRQAGADVGFCQDPDADRLAVIDAHGRYLGEEYTLAMCLDHVLQYRKGAVVANCASSSMSQDLARKHDVPYYRAAVGEANVVDLMLAKDAAFGGEGNGGPIDPRVGMIRDSFVGMAQLLDWMARRERPIGELADELPRYEIVKTKFALPQERVGQALDALERHFSDARSDRLDGLRLDWPGRWLLVRASNTEPIVRAIAEAATAKEAQKLCEEAERVLGSI